MSWRKSREPQPAAGDAPAVDSVEVPAVATTVELSAPAAPNTATLTGTVAGDRGIPSVNRGSSVQSRITRALAVGLGAVVFVLGSAWYVKANVNRMAKPAADAQASAKAKAAGDMPVPPLGPVTLPTRHAAATSGEVESAPEDAAAEEGSDDRSALAAVLGDRPEPPNWRDYAPAEEVSRSTVPRPLSVGPGVPAPIDRRLQGEVFATSHGGSNSNLSSGVGDLSGLSVQPLPSGTDPATATSPSTSATSLISAGVARATRLPTRRWWLPKGTFLDCTLETAIDSTLPGLVTGVLASDTYGADGQVVLLERGTRLLGEASGSVTRGQQRLRVIWQEARTPTGVVIALESPGTDALGRAGVTGEVDRHFGERFGAAMLVSVIDGAVQAAVAAQRDGNGNAVVVSPSGSQDIATEVLKDTISIPPTIRVAPGERLQVLVAKDVDFRGVYGLERRSR